jgi:aspartyl aminopeptidase
MEQPSKNLKLNTGEGTRFLERAKDCVSFLNTSRDPFHAVDSVRKRLTAAKFVELKEKDCWDKTIVKGGRYWCEAHSIVFLFFSSLFLFLLTLRFTRNQSSIVAFCVGGRWKSGNGFSLVGAHTDSPCLKVKGNSNTAV